MKLRAVSVRWETEAVRSIELRHPDAASLPEFTPGAHLDLRVPGVGSRSYSLVSQPEETDRYVIGVQRDVASRGGSKWMCDAIRPGDILEVDEPSNNFELENEASHSVLIAGGIGITPLLCMATHLERHGRCWEFWYAARTPERAPFLDRLRTLDPQGERVRIIFDEVAGGRMLDIGAVVASAPAGSHYYCCGPVPMLKAFEEAVRDIEANRIHTEYFQAAQPVSTAGAFQVVAASSGLTLEVPEGKTIIEVLRAAGIEPPSSCLEGVCGTCETRVIEGVPDHRDLVLTEEEKARNETMMICCSRSKGGRLVLEI